MNIGSQINNWFNKYRQYFFTYKNGFFELSFLANSPESIVNSFDKMIFNKHNPKTQTLTTNNIFCKGELYYNQFEEEFWLILSSIHYKKNIAFKLIYDSTIEKKFYTLSLNIKKKSTNNKAWRINKFAVHKSNWTFFKPQYAVLDCNLKDTEGVFITIYFTKKWLEEKFYDDKKIIESHFFKIILEDKDYILYPTNLREEYFFVQYFENLLIDIKAMWLKMVLFWVKFRGIFDLPNERVISSAEEQLMSIKFGA